MKNFLRNNGLSLVLVSTFLSIWVGQILVGRQVLNDEREERGEPPLSVVQYLKTGHFVEATAENWESEFLQMGAFVWLTSFLFQKGSPESNDPDHDEPEPPIKPDSPWAARCGGWIRTLYSYSLTLAFLLLFLISFLLHTWGGSIEYSEEQVSHGKSPVNFWEYLGTAQMWFESLQNWQSEFLAIAAMVILAIYLRQDHSPESKAVNTPHHENE